MNRNVVFLVLVVFAIGLGGLFLLKKQAVVPSYMSPSLPTPLVSPRPSSLLQGGSSFLDPNGLYSFLYPNDYKIDSQNNGEVTRIYKYGATQKGQTEIYDGVLIVFESINLNGQTLSTWVSERPGEEKKSVSVNGFPGFTYKTQGQGEFQSYVLQKNEQSQNAVQFTTLVADPQNVGFQIQVDEILSTLKLLK